MTRAKQEFTSVAQILKEAGHESVEIKDHAVANQLFDTRAAVTWFYKLGIVVHNNNNDCYQLKIAEGKWLKRKSRSNGWFAIPVGDLGFYRAMKEAQMEIASNIIESE